ncbi:MAG: hypothetical protein QOD07_345 [Frankiaceae bacterium]|jgi:anti-sigma-K factor RskA|nr:hypothetical protein [Frankiaceae bacterium]
MTDSHEFWDELAAAHALHALEPDEEVRLLAHVDGCATCRGRLDDYNLVAAQLGSLSDDDVRPPSWADIRSQLPGARATTEARPAARVVPLRRPVLGARVLAAAAALVVLAGAGVAWQLSRPGASPSASTAALAACRHQAGCQLVQMRGRRGDTADVLVVDGAASLVPLTLPVLPAGRTYVLWQLPRDGSPLPVVSFSDATRQTPKVLLPADYADTAAFAVSVEAAGSKPTRPTDVLAAGAATN